MLSSSISVSGLMPAAPALHVDAPQPAVAHRSTVTSWKRDITLFALSMVTLVAVVAGVAGGVMWKQLRDTSVSEHEWADKVNAAGTARQALLEVDRLLMKTIVLKDPDAVRRSAVASIAAATKVEDAVLQLQDVFPGDKAVIEMCQAVDEAKAPRMKVIGLARKGDPVAALSALNAIDPLLRNIDERSSSLIQRLDRERMEALAEREKKFHRLLMALGGAVAGGIGLSLGFYLFLMRRLSRVDQIEHLLTEVRHGSQQLTEDGSRLEELNAELRQANTVLGSSISRFRQSFQAMDQDSTGAVQQIGSLTADCDHSAATSRTQASHAAEVAQHIGTTVTEMTGLRTVTEALASSQQQIADFTERISRIASTTRLLSMNAAVEAARAGEAGRSFNVVAQSIRQLSDDTHAAAGEIRRTNDYIASQLKLTTEAVQRTDSHMNDCALKATVLQASAGENCRLVENVAARLSEFHASVNRQMQRVRELDHDVAVLDHSLAVGQSHVERLDDTAGSLNQVSSNMLTRLASVS